ncbi:MAG TPA: MFS transporter, partial [Pirellulales bacterium]
APAMKELLTVGGQDPNPADVRWAGGVATAVFLLGWATGGLAFGVLGDQLGRAKTMMITILLYSICTGLSSFSVGLWDFCFYRFITGVGVGGEFAVGVALVAEVMPARARPYCLSLVQALSAVGNFTAAFISVGLGDFERTGGFENMKLFGDVQLSAWRVMFLIGTLPALLALVVRGYLKEPEQWKAASADDVAKKQLGSVGELFTDPRWRPRFIVGFLLAVSGIIGLWGIGFFMPELQTEVFRKSFEGDYRRDIKADEHDRDFVRLAVADPNLLKRARERNVSPGDVIDVAPTDPKHVKSTDSVARAIYGAALALEKAGQPVTKVDVLEKIAADGLADAKKRRAEGRVAPTDEELAAAIRRRSEYLSGDPASPDFEGHIDRIKQRSTELGGRLQTWVGYTGMLQQVGAFFGMFGFGLLTARVGRRVAFAIAYVAAAVSTMIVFQFYDDWTDVFWMVPLMGFCQLSLFAGFAIYLPELFPTRLRSTGVSFCYNGGRFIAAVGPYMLAQLTVVFADYPEPYRPAGLVMCSIFALGLMVLPFAPETKGQPLPE